MKGMLPGAKREQLNHPLIDNTFFNIVIDVSLLFEMPNDHFMSLHYLKVKDASEILEND